MDSMAHMELELYGNRLRTLTWMMRCVANEPQFPPPDGVNVINAIDLTMDALDNQADQLDELVERVRRHVNRIEDHTSPQAHAFRERRGVRAE